MGNRECNGRRLMFLLIGTLIFFVNPAFGAEDPDELYRKGRFAEAEKLYARSDMDHPKDLRYRYNRGCSDYQAADFKGAMAAFSSVLRRANDKETRLKAAYNSGNTAFKQGDFASAVAHYKQAILLDPEKENARYNLEIALRKLEAQKKQKKEGQKSSAQGGDQTDSSKGGEKEKRHEKPSSDRSSEKKEAQKRNREDKSPGKEPVEEKKQGDEKETVPGKSQRGESESPEDLSGDLKPRKPLPEQEQQDTVPGQAVSLMDRKKAEALLDNVTEDRSRFLEFQLPEGKRRGVLSGKDW
ncbi:MAG: tetratricopeptide repeat protein [Deltaproteobacteria bacterium]|nr:tetratricopeptide repeat protein [Deltaproteobacteria bacterium]